MSLPELGRELLAALRAGAALVLLGLTIGIAVYVAGRSEAFQAIATLQLIDHSADAGVVAAGVPIPGPPTGAMLLGEPVMAELKLLLRSGKSSSALRESIHVDQTADTNAELVAQGATPEEAQRLANSWATAVVLNRNAELNAVFENARSQREKELQTARLRGNARLIRTARRKLASVRAAQAGFQGDTALVTAAASGAPVQGVRLGLALGAGLVLGLLAALGYGLAGRRLRTPAAIASALSVPYLAAATWDDQPDVPNKAARQVLAHLDHHAPGWTTLAVSGLTQDTRDAELVCKALQVAVVADGRPIQFVDRTAATNAPSPAVNSEADTPRLAGIGNDNDNMRTLVLVPTVLDSPDTIKAVNTLDAWLLVARTGATRAAATGRYRREVRGLTRDPIGVVVVTSG